MIDARNVTNDAHSNFYACSEFLDKVTNAYLICGALHHFNMETLAEDPKKNIYTGDPNAKQTKQTYRIYLPISRAIFSEIWTCIDQKHSQQRGSAYSREFDRFFFSLRCWELMEMSRKFCDRLVAKSK